MDMATTMIITTTVTLVTVTTKMTIPMMTVIRQGNLLDKGVDTGLVSRIPTIMMTAIRGMGDLVPFGIIRGHNREPGPSLKNGVRLLVIGSPGHSV